MTVTYTLDNDVVLKLSYYGLLGHLLVELSALGSCAVLGTAKYVIPKQVKRAGHSSDTKATLEGLNEFLASVEHLEPSQPEIEFATRLEDSALRQQLELDVGESLLCSISSHRLMLRLITGDKRAIQAMETAITQFVELSSLKSNVACIEQVIWTLCIRLGHDLVRSTVCSAPTADRALTLCFNCFSPEIDPEHCFTGLASYINDLRNRAPSVLVDGFMAW